MVPTCRKLVYRVLDPQHPADRPGQLTGHQPDPREPHGSRGDYGSRDADQVVRISAAKCVGHSTPTEARVRDDDGGTCPPARVDGRGQIETRRHQQRDSMSGPYADATQPVSQRLDPFSKLAERCHAGAAAAQLGDGRTGVAAGQGAGRDTDNLIRSRLERRPVGRRRLRPRADLGSHPRPGILGGLRCVLHDQVRCLGVPVEVRVRQPALQIAKRGLREDRVSWAPQQQRRNGRELSQSGGQVIEYGAAGMAWLQGNVGDEIADRAPSISA